MPISITRWKISDKQTMALPTKNAVQPYIEAGLTNGIPKLINGPDHGLAADEYVCERFWVTEAMAQNWIDQIDHIAKQSGCECLEKSIRDDN